MATARGTMGAFWRRKTLDIAYLQHSEWVRSLTAFELIAMAFAPGVGLGAFFLVPYSVRFLAGPSATISAIIAILVAYFTGCQFAEFARLFPKSGSIYSYAYIVFGEMTAFCTGWTMVVSYCLATALVTKQWSLHVDYLLNGSPHKLFGYTSTIGSGGMLDFTPDYLAMIGVVVSALLCCLGTSVLALVALVLEAVAILILTSSILVGFFYTSTENWSTDFFLNETAGVASGASVILVAFLGLEFLSCFAEEVTNPKNQFNCVINTVCIFCSAFCGCIALVISLVLPVPSLPEKASLPSIFGLISVPASRYVLSVGSVCYLSASSVTISLPVTRVLHAMSKDKLLCDVFGYLTKRKGVPLFNILIAAITSALFVCIDTKSLLTILTLSVSFRFLLCNLAKILITCCPQTMQLDPADMAHYRHLRDPCESLSYSYMSANGTFHSGHIAREISTNLRDVEPSDDEISVTSSFILRGIAAASLDTISHLEGSQCCNGRLVSPTATNCQDSAGKPRCNHLHPPNRSVSSQNFCPSHQTKLALNGAANGNAHNCLKSPCSPDDKAHIYDRGIQARPYRRSFGARSCESQDESAMDAPKPVLRTTVCTCLTAFILFLLYSICMHFADLYNVSPWWFLLAISLSILCVVLASLVVCVARQQSLINVKQPPKSLLKPTIATLLLIFLLASTELVTWLKLFFLMAPGLVVYIAYSMWNSKERQKRSDRQLAEETVEVSEHEGIVSSSLN